LWGQHGAVDADVAATTDRDDLAAEPELLGTDLGGAAGWQVGLGREVPGGCRVVGIDEERDIVKLRGRGQVQVGTTLHRKGVVGTARATTTSRAEVVAAGRRVLVGALGRFVTGVSRPEDQKHPEVEIARAAECIAIAGDGGGDNHGIVRSTNAVSATTGVGLGYDRVAGWQHLQVAVAGLNRATGGDIQTGTIGGTLEEIDTRLEHQRSLNDHVAVAGSNRLRGVETTG